MQIARTLTALADRQPSWPFRRRRVMASADAFKRAFRWPVGKVVFLDP
jgi:hypothetical protein